jgi:amino acid adenylation domain-containing protein
MRTATSSSRSIFEQVSDLRHTCPHAVALCHGERQLSYGQLASQVDRFAGYLVRLGLMPGDTVAVCLERSFDWIVAALGIMQAGAAYVPLDSSWPESRLQFALTDSRATFLIARAPLLDRLGWESRGVDPNRDALLINGTPELAHGTTDPESLAYVIYTSGSTGVPKGVEITHANLAHLIRWHRDAFGVTSQDRASHLAGLGFDAAGWEIWPHLAAGTTVCLADDLARSSPALLLEWIVRERVTIAFVPTVHAARMIEMEWPTHTALRLLLTGGDVLHRAPAVQLPFDVVNNYGPTECTVVATSAVIKAGEPSTPPIGRPITNATLYLLNESGDQVRDGECGEIYIGGGGVGRGYRNLPDATERSFLPDPFIGIPNVRMYRTGDRGVRRPDGEIEFHGRLDRQTKIRGQRVELDEIATILSRHPSLDFATAISKVAENGENYLVAYVRPRENTASLTVIELRRFLLSSLPDYMIPAVYVRLQTIPLSPNGKLDLSLLEQPTEENRLEKTSGSEPVTPIEQKLLAIARNLLRNEALQTVDNFFLAGGHSLLGMQFLMRVRDAFGVDLTVQQLFEAPTVERLAFLIETKLAERRLTGIWSDLLGVKRVGLDVSFADLGARSEFVAALQQRITAEFGRDIPVIQLLNSPTVHQQAELLCGCLRPTTNLPSGVLALEPQGSRKSIFWVHYLDVGLAKALGDDQHCLFVKLTAEDMALLGETPTLQEVAKRLLSKVLATQPKGPYILGGYCLGGIVAYEIAFQLRAAGREVSLLVLLDPPNRSYLERHALAPRLSEPSYLVRRLVRLGLRTTLHKIRERFLEHFGRSLEESSAGTEITAPPEQLLIERAAGQYHPPKYDGTVLLLLASDRSRHVDFLPGWQAVIANNLRVEHLDAHHDALMDQPTVNLVANAIVSQVVSTTDPTSLRS